MAISVLRFIGQAFAWVIIAMALFGFLLSMRDMARSARDRARGCGWRNGRTDEEIMRDFERWKRNRELRRIRRRVS